MVSTLDFESNNPSSILGMSSFLDHSCPERAPNPSASEKTNSASNCELTTDSAAGLNYEKSTSRTLGLRPETCTISRASSLVSPPMTDGAETPGIHLLLITSTSKETKMTSAFSLSRCSRPAKTCPACVRTSHDGSTLCLRMSRSIQSTSAPLERRYSQWMLEQVAPLLPNSTKWLWDQANRGSSSMSRKGEPECAFPSFSGRTSKWESRLMTAMGLLGQVDRRAETLGQLWSLDPPTATSKVSVP